MIVNKFIKHFVVWFMIIMGFLFCLGFIGCGSFGVIKPESIDAFNKTSYKEWDDEFGTSLVHVFTVMRNDHAFKFCRFYLNNSTERYVLFVDEQLEGFMKKNVVDFPDEWLPNDYRGNCKTLLG